MATERRYELTALDPYDLAGLRSWSIWIDQEQMDWLLGKAKKKQPAPEHRLARLKLVEEVAIAPIVVFRGLDRHGQAASLCYVGKPERDFPRIGVDVPRPPNMVFTFFVLQSGKFFDWRWEPQCPANPDYPENWKPRFTEILWPTPTQLT
jgi:hypothetical protein